MKPVIHKVGTAVPAYDAQSDFLEALGTLYPEKEARILRTLVNKSSIEHRYSVLKAPFAPGGFYSFWNAFPSTRERMEIYAKEAPALALEAAKKALHGISEKPDLLITASCTGFEAPGVSEILAEVLNLGEDVERLHIGFMGCYAGITGLREAARAILAEPSRKVLFVSVELCSLHLPSPRFNTLPVPSILFADGAAAAFLSEADEGLGIEGWLSRRVPGTREHMHWKVGNDGFSMHMSPRVPAILREALPAALSDLASPEELFWAVHPGGPSILDAVEEGMKLPSDALDPSRKILNRYGNMSSATVLFVLEELLQQKELKPYGMALAFGPGLSVEGLRLAWK